MTGIAQRACHPGARRDPLGKHHGHFTERTALQRVDTGFRRYDDVWLNHVTNQVLSNALAPVAQKALHRVEKRLQDDRLGDVGVEP